MKRIVLLLLSVLVAIALSAGQGHPGKDRQPAAPAIPSAPQSIEMKKMTDSFAGMWKTTTTIEPGGFMPKGGTASGHADIRSGPAGNVMVERFRSHGALGNFAGMGLIWWDAKAAAYRALWCDSLTPSGCETTGTGKWEGDNLVFTGESEMEGKKLRLRETYSAITPDSFTFVMETGIDSAPMAKSMTVQYQRTTPKATPAGNQ